MSGAIVDCFALRRIYGHLSDIEHKSSSIAVMKFANEGLFLVFALVMGGLFISSLPFFGGRKLDKTNNYWRLALGMNIVTFLLFASASTVSPILLTFANTFFFASYFFLFIFCRALNDKPVAKLVAISPLLFVAFGFIFEYMRQFGVFQDRVLFVISFLILCLIGMLIELFQFQKRERHIQIDFLIFTCIAEIVLAVIRVGILLENTTISASTIYTEPFSTTLIRWFALSFTILSYISINGFLTERLARSNAESLENTVRVTNLLVERDALIESLMKTNKSAATGALSASIAHELNQPLGASLLNIQFLKMLHESGELTPELTNQLLNQLEGDAKRSGNIIRSLQSIFVKDTTGYEVIQVNEIVSSALDIYKSDLVSKGIKVISRVDEDISVTANKGQLLQVLINLVNNAIQALSQADIPSKGIQVNCLRQDKNCIVEIIDNGPGISKERQKRLFELLNTDKSKGMGLGLWLCSQIMNNFGGHILYEDALGGGAKFILTLPITPPEILRVS